MGRMGHPLCLKFIVFCLVLQAAFRSQEGTLMVSFLNVLTASGFFVIAFVVCWKARFGISQAPNLGLAVLGTGKVGTCSVSRAQRVTPP